MNKLVFLGTGSAAHLSRQMTSLCFVTSQGSFLIDCGDGMGTMRHAVRAGIDIDSINDVFITHRHADHVIGMSHFLFLRMLDPSARVRVWGPAQALSAVKWLAFRIHDFTRKHADRIEWRPLRSREKVKLGRDVSVSTVKVKGPDGNPIVSYAYKVIVDKTSIVFTGDMQPTPAFDRLANRADILVHECFGLAKDEKLIHQLGHCTVKDAGVLAQKAEVKKLFLTHLPTRDFDIAEEKLAFEAAQYFSGDVRIAEDLMEVAF